jgi:hypothetical protein
VLALTSYPALDVLIGLAFFYFLLSIISSSINEGLATVFALRAHTLETWIRELLGKDELAKTFYENGRVQAFTQSKWWFGLRKNRKPSYLPSRVFALALLDTIVPPTAEAGAPPSQDLIAKAEEFAKKVPIPQLKTMIQDALTAARGDIDKFREALERQFDEAMERVSGWYKRRVQLVLFVIALALVGSINADSFTIGQRLWKDDVLRSTVAAQAQKTVANTQAECAKTSGGTTPNPAEVAGKCLDQVKELNLPVGWSKASTPSTFVEGLAKAGGLLLTAFALMLGAPFWFDTLSKLAQLRGSGRASANPSTPEGATTTKTPA